MIVVPLSFSLVSRARSTELPAKTEIGPVFQPLIHGPTTGPPL